ncbi:hypothetical protein C478_06426 [Natrinema thermotolerans DSM 11552]|nr:hypothetical protein C478_06426 [Natrinema thermotolerans DSM 11552]
MTRYHAAHERVTFPESPLEEPDEFDAHVGYSEATDSDGSAARRLGWSKTSAFTPCDHGRPQTGGTHSTIP